MRKLEFPKLAYILAAFIFVTGVFLQWEYFSQTRLRWNQANKLSSDTGLITQIFVDGVWDRFNLAKKNNDKKLMKFCEDVLEVYEKDNINGHIVWKK